MMKLTDFQQAAVDYIVHRLTFKDCRRFLCADEVGLGKTIIAKGVIDALLLKGNGSLKVFYICSSQYLALRNLVKLHPAQQQVSISRLTEVIKRQDLTVKKKGLQILPLSPQTSVDLKSRGGKSSERAILYHLLKQFEPLKGKRYQTYKKILSLGIKGWETDVKQLNPKKELNQQVTELFLSKLSRDKETRKHLLACFEGLSVDYLSLIGKLRELLAVTSLIALKPDLIILDEFQRFAPILKNSENVEATELLKTLFRNTSSKMLLLSATPYKMLTVRDEHLEGSSHYEEFDFLMQFLMGKDYELFSQNWKAYSDAIFSLKQYEPHELESIKDNVERILYQYVCRTERRIAYESEYSLVKSVHFLLPFNRKDIDNFIRTDSIAKRIQEEPKFSDLYSPLEYCKTAPFPLSFMENYKMKNILRDLLSSKAKLILPSIIKNNEAYLNYNIVNNYTDKAFPNAKIQWLAEEIVKKGTSLLWIPPAIPYYRLDGAFKNAAGFSKMLIFGKFAVEPRMISVLASYKAECVTTGNKAFQNTAEKTKRKYFTVENDKIDQLDNEDIPEAKRFARHPRRRLYFKNDDTSFSMLSFYYPSIYLSDLVTTNLKIDVTKSLKSVLRLFSSLIGKSLKGIEKFSSAKKGSTQARWTIFALLYLDYKFNKDNLRLIVRENANRKLDNFKLNKKTYKIFDYAKTLVEKGPEVLAKELDLGAMPKNLNRILSLIALGSPSTLMFQSLNQYTDAQVLSKKNGFDFINWTMSFGIAEGFRSFYNQPEHITIIDFHSSTKDDYWLSLLEYNASGCLKSVLDEFLYTYTDGLLENTESDNHATELLSKTLANIVSLGTASLFVDLYDTKTNGPRRAAMRTHYAISFTDQPETDETIAHKGEVQDSFNSPFRPFILSTTSIGQEGLDFHKYCRQLLHWSLPGNAIELEQREGRIDRYKNYSIRLNLANRFRKSIHNIVLDRPVWVTIFNLAEMDTLLRNNKCDLIPYWHVPLSEFPIERIVPLFPFSKDQQKLDNLLRTLTLYRISLGQPNQEDLIKYLLNNYTKEELDHFKAKLLINLSPIAVKIQTNME